MTKSEEIAFLRAVATKLGQHSYCGPWLASVADEVEQQVRGDFFPSPSIKATQATCAAMVTRSTEIAQQIESDARTKGDRMIREVEDRISGIKSRTRIKLQLALQDIETI